MIFLKKIGAFFEHLFSSLIKTEDGKISPYKIGLIFVTFALYSLLITWKFAFLVMIAIGWHESGHVWALRRLNMPTKGFYFLPFIGGVAVSSNAYRSLTDKVIVAIMGPIWGMLLALATWIAYLLTNNVFWGAAAFWQATLNLFNLLPINPLDGGQIGRAVFASVGKKVADAFSLLSVFAFIGLFVAFKTPIFVLAAVFAFKDFWMSFKHNMFDAEQEPLSRADIINTSFAYLLLTGILAVIMVFTSVAATNLETLFMK